jgi:glucokinase
LPTVTGGPDAVAKSVIDTVRTIATAVGASTIDAIGLGIPGLVDPVAGSVRQAVNLGIGQRPLDLVDRLSNEFGAHCRIDNDVNVAAIGVHRLLSMNEQESSLAYLSIGTGIAAGVMLQGHLHRGTHGLAGEIGHFPIVAGGPSCECGLNGCLETVASGSAIARAWESTGTASPAEALFSAASAGDRRAELLRNQISDYLAQAVYLLAITFDVERVVIGGGVADVGAPLVDAIADALNRLGDRSSFVQSLDLQNRVSLKPSGDVGALGAAALVTASLGYSNR